MEKNLINIVILLVSLWLWPMSTNAQFRPEIDVQEWPKGKVVLTSGDTLYGALTYHRTQEIVNVQHSDGSFTCLSPVNVEYFVAQEMPSGRSQVFKTLRWDMGREHSDFKKPTFFEELNSGTLTLIKREAYVRREASNSRGLASNDIFNQPSDSGDSQWRDQVKELYYVLLPDGNIIYLKNIRKDLHSLFGNKSRDIKSYVKQNKLEYDKSHELIAIVNYFNALTMTTSHAF